MNPKNLAKMFAKFRKNFSTVKDPVHEKQLVKYYLSMIRLKQVFPLFNETGILIALGEVWRIKESDIKSIKSNKMPTEIAEGNVFFIANVTIDPKMFNFGIYAFYKKFLKDVIYKNEEGKKTFWYNYRRKRFSRIFEV